MLNYLPQEESKLAEWVDRFVTLAGAFLTQLPLTTGDLEHLKEHNTRLKQGQVALTNAMDHLFGAKADLERAKAELDRMETEIRMASDRKNAAGEEVRRKALKMDDLEALRAADASLRMEQSALNAAMERFYLPKAEFEKAKIDFERTETEIRIVLDSKKLASEEVRKRAYGLVEPLRALPEGNEQFLQMIGIPLAVAEQTERVERAERVEPVERMERPEPQFGMPEEFECTPHAEGINLLKWKANSPAGTLYNLHYAIGGWHRGSPTAPSQWSSTPIVVPENSEFRNGDYIQFPHNSRQGRRTNIAYQVTASHDKKVSAPTSQIVVECK